MDFNNRIKGAVTQVLLKSLLEDAGYGVIPLGIEEAVREIKLLEKDQYKQLDFSPTLRTTPDFLVIDWNSKQNWLVEVKYRKKWNNKTRDDLADILKSQVRWWGGISVLFFLGEHVDLVNSHNPDFANVGVATLSIVNDELVVHHGVSIEMNGKVIFPPYIPWSKAEWKDLTWLNKAFGNLKCSKRDDRVTKCIKIAQCLAEKLDFSQQSSLEPSAKP